MKKLAVIGTFVAGASVGFVTCGVLTVRGVLKSEKLKGAIANVISDKVVETMHESDDYRRQPHSRPKVSYTSYYDRYPSSRKLQGCIFETREKAEEVLSTLDDLAVEYGEIKVADVCELCDIICDHYDNEFGWASTDGMKVVMVRNGYMIDFPKAVKLN